MPCRSPNASNSEVRAVVAPLWCCHRAYSSTFPYPDRPRGPGRTESAGLRGWLWLFADPRHFGGRVARIRHRCPSWGTQRPSPSAGLPAVFLLFPLVSIVLFVKEIIDMAGMNGPATGEKRRLGQSCSTAPTPRSRVKRVIYRPERLDSGILDVQRPISERGRSPVIGHYGI